MSQTETESGGSKKINSDVTERTREVDLEAFSSL